MSLTNGPQNTTDSIRLTKVSEDELSDAYFAVSSSGARVRIPKELFEALQEFLETRKHAGSITLQFRSGDIICVEALAKKTYRKQ